MMKRGVFFKLMIAFCIISTSCTGMEDYLDIVGRDEIIYPGKISSVQAYSGHNRVVIEGLCVSDARVVDCEIVWSLGKESLVVPVDMSGGPFELKVEIELAENIYNFDLYTRDALGNRSIPVNVTAQVYGEGYQLQIRNRSISGAHMSGTSGVIEWYPMDITLGPLYSELTYTAVDGQTRTVRSSVTDEAVVLDNIDKSKPVTLVTLYRPEEICLDVFTTEPYEFYIN